MADNYTSVYESRTFFLQNVTNYLHETVYFYSQNYKSFKIILCL